MYVLYEFLWQNVFVLSQTQFPSRWLGHLPSTSCFPCCFCFVQFFISSSSWPWVGSVSIVFCLLLIACCLIQWTLPIACCLSPVAIWCVCLKKITLGMVFGTEQWADTIGNTIGNTIWQIPGPPLGIYIYIYMCLFCFCALPQAPHGGPRGAWAAEGPEWE